GSPTFGSVPQVKVGPVVCVYETKVAPPGRVSLNVAAAASSGPPLPNVIVKVMFVLMLAVAGAVLVTNRSADCAAAVTATRKVNTTALTSRRCMLDSPPAVGETAYINC